ncbi:MAG: hypothetical protein ACLR1T_10860 [Evtepia gabavorous]
MEWKKRRRILWGAWALALGLAVSAWFVSLPDVPALPAGQTAAALPPKGYLALTFDDGPWPKTTEALLDGLAQRGSRPPFSWWESRWPTTRTPSAGWRMRAIRLACTPGTMCPCRG